MRKPQYLWRGRLLDDDGDVLLKFEDGATGVLSASQVATGEENALKLRIYGEKAGLEWRTGRTKYTPW
ncbi:Gfo/Idh/MocA family protein [Sphingobacterium daejeonense]|uniref:Gfo/Idh/MocA family protein n=1 Tax=Sphingobacterium daejeonense TaxID=371142 RepID=UPI0037438C32